MNKEYLEVIYTRLRLHLYKGLIAGRDAGSLTMGDIFTAKVIETLEKPTLKELAEFMEISLPNASYKVDCLVKKGYAEKEKSQLDRREVFISVTEKFIEEYGSENDSATQFVDTVVSKLTERECQKLRKVLKEASEELWG